MNMARWPKNYEMIRNKTEQNAWFAAPVKSCSLFKHLESLIPYNFYLTNGIMVYNKSHDKKKKKKKIILDGMLCLVNGNKGVSIGRNFMIFMMDHVICLPFN